MVNWAGQGMLWKANVLVFLFANTGDPDWLAGEQFPAAQLTMVVTMMICRLVFLLQLISRIIPFIKYNIQNVI